MGTEHHGNASEMNSVSSTFMHGKEADNPNYFAEISFQEATEKYGNYMHAAHACIYALCEDGDVLWDGTKKNAVILLQARFDGRIGFPGGMLDQGPEHPVEGLNRELEEEIGLDISKFGFKESEHSTSHINHKRRMITHFYVKHIKLSELVEIEKGVLTAKEWGRETYGTLRVPLYAMQDGYRGFPIFLCNNFAGNAKDQLISTIRNYSILPADYLDKLLKAHEEYKKL